MASIGTTSSITASAASPNLHDDKALSSSSSSSPSSPSSRSRNLWSVQECLDRRDEIQFVDATWFHKGGRDGRAEFEVGPRLPGAQYLDFVDVATSYDLYPADNPKGLLAMFPPVELMGAVLMAMNLTVDRPIVVYGREGTLFAPRVWYMLQRYINGGVGSQSSRTQEIVLMQGSLEEWIERGGPVDTEVIEYNLWAKDLVPTIHDSQTTTLANGTFPVSSAARDWLVDMEQVLAMIRCDESMGSDTSEDGDEYDQVSFSSRTKVPPVIIDTRGSSFAKGHIPGAIHIPYSSLTEPGNSLRLKPRDELEAILNEKVGQETLERCRRQGPDQQHILLTCGSGVSVCHMALVLQECGYADPFIYDGSWNEWGSDPNTPKVT